MAKGYMFYDGEIANSAQRLCQVAYILADEKGNQIGEPVVSLIDPESEWQKMTYRHHRVRPNDVAGAPNFLEFCEQTGFIELLEQYIFVAHNAKGADLYHISKSLMAYGIEMPEVEFIDTMEYASAFVDLLALKKVCAHFGIPLEKHHDALCDAFACKGIFEELRKIGDLEETVWLGKASGSPRRAHKSSKHYGGLGVTNGDGRPLEEVLDEFEAMGLRGNPDDIDNLNGMRIVVTGIVPGYPGDGVIEAALREEGAVMPKKPRVIQSTEYLAIGCNAGNTKLDKAKLLGVPVITVGELLEVLDRQ